jgi:hypothetical protein
MPLRSRQIAKKGVILCHFHRRKESGTILPFRFAGKLEGTNPGGQVLCVVALARAGFFALREGGARGKEERRSGRTWAGGARGDRIGQISKSWR